MSKSVKIIISTALSFGIYFIIDDLFFNSLREWLNGILNQRGLSHIIAYSITGIPIAIGTIYIHKFSGWIGSLGLKKSLLKGGLFALLCTSPMLVGYAIVFDLNREITLNGLLISVFAAAFFEELYFRGFLFGQLYKFTKLGFIPSVAIGALLFAFLHLYQSDDIFTLIGIFGTTFLGAVLFAWAYSEWKHNLWVPIFLHLFMNLFWMLFSAGDNALGGLYANIFRVLTIVVIIAVTVVYKKKQGIKFDVNKQTLWMKTGDKA